MFIIKALELKVGFCYNRPPLSISFISCDQLGSENITWKTPEINNSCILNYTSMWVL